MKISAKRRPLSLAVRLTLFISLSTILAFLIFTWVMINSVEQHFSERDVYDLKQISSVLENIIKEPKKSEAQKIEKLSDILTSYQNITALLRDGNNNILYHSSKGADLSAILPSQYPGAGKVLLWSGKMSENEKHSTMANKNTIYRIIETPIKTSENTHEAPYILLTAMSFDYHQHYIDTLKVDLIYIALAISVLIVLIVLFAVYKGHQPLRNVSMKIKDISSENLDVRLEPDRVPIELEQLVISFNHMLERIEDVFIRQANFSADIAHEIRTPITNLVTQTEILLSQSRSNDELKEVLYSNLEEYNRMAKMTSDMLFLAQADNNQLIPEQVTLDLRDETSKVFEFFEAWAEDRGVRLAINGDASRVKGDPLMLRRVINNLVSNAIRYTPGNMTVTAHINERERWVDLIIENPGTPIPEEHLNRLFDRFYRVDPSRQRKSEGSGIGLAIVKSIITVHQGKISVASDAVSTRFTISLPKFSD